jgi:hypothetical protein
MKGSGTCGKKSGNEPCEGHTMERLEAADGGAFIKVTG